MAKILEKIALVLAKFSSLEDPESVTAAAIAVKLIKEHGVVLSLPDGHPEADPSAPRGPRNPPPAGFEKVEWTHESFMRDFFPSQDEVKEYINNARRAAPPDPFAPHARPAQPRAVRIHTRFSGACRVCGIAYQSGAEVFWVSGEGAVHPQCVGSWKYKPEDR